MRQAVQLKLTYPDCFCEVYHNRLIWKGAIKPTELSRTYKIKVICHGFKGRPRVVLYGNEIPKISCNSFPHHFKIDRKSNEVELCLHMPYEFDYRYNWIADTIIPWAQEWLYFFEIWLATGEWCGGGHTPN